MSIIYTIVARGALVLAEYSSTTGNFTQISRRILEKIPQQDGKMSYVYDKFAPHPHHSSPPSLSPGQNGRSPPFRPDARKTALPPFLLFCFSPLLFFSVVKQARVPLCVQRCYHVHVHDRTVLQQDSGLCLLGGHQEALHFSLWQQRKDCVVDGDERRVQPCSAATNGLLLFQP